MPPSRSSLTGSPTLVTGGTGLLGNNIVRTLLSRGRAVRVLVREESRLPSLKGLEVSIAKGDLRDSRSIHQALIGCGSVIHCAALVRIGSRNIDEFRAVNVAGTEALARCANEFGIPLVHVSSSDTITSPRSGEKADESFPFDSRYATAYSLSKAEAEEAILREIEAGLDATIVNPSFLLGPWDWRPSSGQMLLAVAKGFGSFPPRGEVSVADARDVAMATIAALSNGQCGQRYLLTGETLSYLALWRKFAEVSNAKRPVIPLGPVFSFVAGAAGDLFPLFGKEEPPVNSAALRAARAPKRYSHHLASQELDYEVRPLSETIRDAWQWMQSVDLPNHGRSKRDTFV